MVAGGPRIPSQTKEDLSLTLLHVVRSVLLGRVYFSFLREHLLVSMSSGASSTMGLARRMFEADISRELPGRWPATLNQHLCFCSPYTKTRCSHREYEKLVVLRPGHNCIALHFSQQTLHGTEGTCAADRKNLRSWCNQDQDPRFKSQWLSLLQ